jgi:hypothetical protein
MSELKEDVNFIALKSSLGALDFDRPPRDSIKSIGCGVRVLDNTIGV